MDVAKKPGFRLSVGGTTNNLAYAAQNMSATQRNNMTAF
jgi:hypothetical protein